MRGRRLPKAGPMPSMSASITWEREMAAKQGYAAVRRQRGVTLIELIMVLVIGSVLVCLCAPSMRGMLAHQRVRATQLALIGGLQHARATAIDREARVVFCPTRDGLQCSEESRWDNGWLIGIDRNDDNQPDDRPLYVDLRDAKSLAIRSSAGRHAVVFQPDGAASGSNLTLSICDAQAHDQVLSVLVSNAGRVRGSDASEAQRANCLDG
jgi:type IV fimbrial biogenesis protein FimT